MDGNRADIVNVVHRHDDQKEEEKMSLVWIGIIAAVVLIEVAKDD